LAVNLAAMPGVRAVDRVYDGELRGPPSRRERERALGSLARRQHGVAARRQLAELGFGPDAIDRRISHGRLHLIHRGVYAVGHSLLSQRGWWMAAVLALGPMALLSHRSAGALWGLVGARGPIEVTVPGAAGRRRRGRVLVHVSTRLAAGDRAVRDRIPVTAIPRTLLDLATTLSPTQLSAAFEEADRLGLIERGPLRAAIDRNAGHHGAGRLASVAEGWLAPSVDTRTEFERRFRRLCVEEGLPEPAMNVTVCGFEVDALWTNAKVIVELDGYGFHGHRRAFERDRERDAVLQLAGYRVIRITWRRLEREPGALGRMLKALIDSPDSRPSSTRGRSRWR
jgi:very-short-patch-repair endonuclease